MSLFTTAIYITAQELTDSTTSTALKAESSANKIRLINLAEAYIDRYI